MKIKILSHILILVTVCIMAAFGYSLAAGLFGIVYAVAAVILEAVKYQCIELLAKSKSYWKNVAIGALTGTLIMFSGYASWSVIDSQASSNNQVVQEQRVQYENNVRNYELNSQKMSSITSNIANLEKSINDQLSRIDRNTITDQRIQNDRNELNALKSERDTIKIEKPVEPNGKFVPSFIPILISILIELSSALIFFVRNKEQPVPEAESSVPEPVQVKKNTKKYSEQASEQPPKAKKEQFKSVRDELNLTNAQRMKLKRELTKRGIDWKTFNSNKANIEKAKEYVGI